VAEDDLAEVLGVLPKAGFRGVNVTSPHKLAALDVATRPTERAQRIGAANLLSSRTGASSRTTRMARGS
jgi:shikimate dehydrogenase